MATGNPEDVWQKAAEEYERQKQEQQEQQKQQEQADD